MKKSLVFALVIGLCLGGLVCCRTAGSATEESATEPEGSAAEPAPKPGESLVVPAKMLAKAKVVDWQDLLKFLPKAPAGWRATKPTGKVQRMGPFAVSQVKQTLQRGGQRIDLILEDLGSNNPYMFRKEAWKPLERKKEDVESKKIMLGKVPAELTVRKKERRCLVFLVFEKRIQLNVSGTGMSDPKVLVDMAKQIDFAKLKKALEEKSK